MLFSFVIELYSIFANPDEWKSWQYRKKFRLAELPELAVGEILKSMSWKDQIQLALSSKRGEKMCKIARTKVTSISFHVRDDYTNLTLGRAIKLYCGEKELDINEENKIARRELTRWFGIGDSILQNLVSLHEKVNTIFRCNHHNLFIYMNEMNSISLDEVMTIPFLQNCKNLTLAHGEIESEDLCYLLDTMKELKGLRLLGTKIPGEFQHDRAFTIERMEYEDAKWVTLENLLSLKNCPSVKLGSTSITYGDFNRFLKFWANSEIDMFKMLNIKLEGEFDPQTLFDGLLRLDSLLYKTPIHFCMASSKLAERKTPLLLIGYMHNELRMIAHSRISVYKSQTTGEFKSFQSEFDALRILEKREELREKMKRMEVAGEDDVREMEELKTRLDELLAEGKFRIGV